MMSKFMAEKRRCLVKSVEERAAASKTELEEEKGKRRERIIPYIPIECISDILVRLPCEFLQRSRFVCKTWYKIINSRTFIDAHFQRSETVTIFIEPARKGPFSRYDNSGVKMNLNAFSVQSRMFRLLSVPLRPTINRSSLYYMKFMEIINGKMKIEEYNATCVGEIRASCNGLILLDNRMKNGGLIVTNPVTRKVSTLPLGTLYPPRDESYGLAFCQNTGQFKLVHLFRDEMKFIGCEILILGTNSWKAVDGPAFWLFAWFGYDPIFAIRALHWVPHFDKSEYIMSMAVDDEKFRQIPLPKRCRTHDRIVEMRGKLGFVAHNELLNQIDVWIFRDLCGEGWTRQFSIKKGCLRDLTPLYPSRISNEIIFKDKYGYLHSYDCDLQLMRKVEMEEVSFLERGRYLPHVNTLISWQAPVSMVD